MNLLDDAYANVTRMCGFAHKYGAMGTLNTDWGDFGHINHPSCLFRTDLRRRRLPGTRTRLSERALDKAISAVEYGDASESL